jgi:phenylalanyl-tRNA synthetase beta chain
MKISLSWLRDYIAWSGSVAELEDLLTRSGIKVESVTTMGADFPNVIVAQIIATDRHPQADRLSVCEVDDGSRQSRQIVCGAKNYVIGDKVPLALPGAVLPGGLKIKVSKLRGVESEGMLCSPKELGLADDAEGLLILPPEAPIGKPLSALYPSDTIFELEITPNRPDWLSHVGIAREVAAFSSQALQPAALNTSKVVKPAEGNVSIEAPSLCPFYSARRIRGVKVAPSPEWLRHRLEASGVRSINNIVDITNYVMLELGQPLHAFDAEKLSGGIVVRQSREGESFRALDGSELRLSHTDLVIADAEGAIALAGVMGGEQPAVVDKTTDVLLESALFQPASIRRSARLHGLHSESSHRFERGTDPLGVLAASQRATQLIEELAGGDSEEFVMTAGALPPAPDPIVLREAYCRALLGVDIVKDDIEDALRRLELTQAGQEEGRSTWKVPSYRLDLRREVDLIEEVARIIGITTIAGKLLASPAPSSGADRFYDFHMEVRQALCGLGFSEARTSTLVSESMVWPNGEPLRLRNPLGEDQAFLRTSLLPGLLAALRRNIRHGAKSVRLYELGRTFHTAENEEAGRLAFVIYGEALPPSWRDKKGRDLDWHDAKGVVEKLIRDAVACRRTPVRSPMALQCDLAAGEKHLGVLGQLAPVAAREMDALKPVLACEMDLGALQAFWRKPSFQEIPKFPSVLRDIAVVCPMAISYDDIEHEIWASNPEFLVKVEPLSVFVDPTGEKLPADRKSVAISLTFRLSERTLSSEEVNAACDRLKQQLKAKLAVDFRE